MNRREYGRYTDTGYQLLAEIAAKVSGEPFEEFLKKNIFEPAGLDSTRVYHRRKDKLSIDHLAAGPVCLSSPSVTGA